MHTTKPIGVFDSGIGGLTVVRHLIKQLPHERFVYLGDTARVPYGNKSAPTVERYSQQCAEFLLTHDVQCIVVACNTASALALQHLRATVSVPVIGVIEPAAVYAYQQSINGVIGVIGTRATIGSNIYSTTLDRVSHGNVRVHSTACPLFVPLVEEGWLQHAATRSIAEQYIEPLLACGVDTVILGCTHYPLLLPLLGQVAPAVQWIDGGSPTAKYVADNIVQHLHVNEHPTVPPTIPEIRMYVTDTSPMFQQLATQFLGMPSQEPVRVTIEHLTAVSQW
jgi:glutamate racemase